MSTEASNNGQNSRDPREQKNEELQNNQIGVSVRYQEDIVSVQVNKNASLEALLQASIQATENQSVEKNRFQLKLGGNVLDLNKKISDYAITNGSTLLLVLVAGGGGNTMIKNLSINGK